MKKREKWTASLVQTTRLNQAKLNTIIEFSSSRTLAGAAVHWRSSATLVPTNWPWEAMPRRRRRWFPEIQLAHRAHARKTRSLTLMRARSPHPRGPSRSSREGGKGWTGRGDPSPSREEAGRGATSCSPSCSRTATWLPDGLAPAPAASEEDGGQRWWVIGVAASVNEFASAVRDGEAWLLVGGRWSCSRES